MKYLFLLLVFLTNCCPIKTGPPEDASTLKWNGQVNDSKEKHLIDCQGQERGSLNIKSSHTTVQNCIVKGDIRIWGKYRNANHKELIEKSHSENYVTQLRSESPTDILIQNVKIIGKKTIPLYIGPGSTYVIMQDTQIIGNSDSTMVYLGAESHRIIIKNSVIDARNADREAVTIDSSDQNVFRNNIIKYKHGGIFLYRNCGENGVIRHTTPSHNVIWENTFSGKGVAVWLGSREGDRCYCMLDSGWPWGSSISDLDHARHNQVFKNKLNGNVIKQGKSSKFNVVENNMP